MAKAVVKGGYDMSNVSVFSIVLLLTGFTMLAGSGEAAFGQGTCDITVIKEAPGGSGVLFPFEVTKDGGDSFFVDIEGGDSDEDSFNSRVTVTELPLAGWALSDIECVNTGATGFEITDNGFSAGCDGGGSVTCTFFNEQRTIPTLSEWGVITMAAALGIIGLIVALRRRKAAA
jgi:hypothetical protein